jgi:hypothetical protein
MPCWTKEALGFISNTILSAAAAAAAVAAAGLAVACRNGSGLSRCELVYDASASGERRLQQVHNDEWSTHSRA